MTATQTARVIEISAALNVMLRRPAATPVIPGGLPAELYYTGGDLFVATPAPCPIDQTRPLTPLDLEARHLVREGRAGLIRFFAGRWSRRLGRVVRPK